MKLIKESIKGLFGLAGLKISRLSNEPVPQVVYSREELVKSQNFKNLASAYEFLLNQAERAIQIAPDERRAVLLGRLQGTPPPEAYAIIQSIARTRNVEGDVCEFGVAQGETSALMANEIKNSTKCLHLFDSFEGLPKPSEKDQLKDDIFSLGSMEAYAGKMACREELVLARLKSIAFPDERYVIHKGFIEELIQRDEHLPKCVSFAYVDFDFYEPIKVALNFLHGVMDKGAVVLVDDYDYFSTGSKTAVDEFLQEVNQDDQVYDVIIPDKRLGYFALLVKKI